MKIIRADSAGFCFGVRRAYELASSAAGESAETEVATLGELIHNPEVLEELNSRGVRTVAAISEIKQGTVIIRAHGISNKKLRQLCKKDVKVIDASCPFVQNIHLEVAQFAAKKIPVLILGQKEHPELKAVFEDFPEVEIISQIRKKSFEKFVGQKIALLAQTTERMERFEKLKTLLEKMGIQVIAKNTICHATAERQSAAIALAKKVDLVIVVGGKNSNNTKQLFELVRRIKKSRWIENEKDLKESFFTGIKKVGITAGASTPEWVIRKVERAIGQIGENRKKL